MAVSRTSLRGFLTQARGALRAAVGSNQKITFVIGNESADLDSMACAVLYAYVRSMSPPKNAFTPLYVPITNIPASDIQLRPEFLAVFQHANVEPEHLITLDDLPATSDIQSKLRPENTAWILVDHNTLQGQLGKIYSDRVRGVIDHHDDEGTVPKEADNEPRIIEKSGSCTSLTTNYCRAAWDMLSGSASSAGATHAQGDNFSDDDTVVKRWDASVAQLGLASILIDTANLQDQSKTTEHDVRAVEYLEAKIMACSQLSASFDRASFYNEIDTAKRNIGALALRDILRKDYKQWDQGGQKLGISSVVKPIEFLQAKAGSETNTQPPYAAFLDELELFASERELDLYSVMTTSTSSGGEFQRELLLWAFNDGAVAAAKAFVSTSRDELGLEEWHESGDVVNGNHGKGQWMRVWWQRQVQHSRKRVAPLLRESMSSGESRL
ncbi:exopolyphosphatase-like protein [Dothidotthia symphoricarpi CBS 119687]|uniref:Exopolyphosphatase-like protein n=1 Tax=Dothidotthia symphoricarpi CBS 119687 TaxID=1392245 RepID=A0A6A6A2R3_9PLEO|nr:exopolyphosphatase-like protein [Dothidotthia symphoricarpi CBS 119687]KAF2125473.1 exopolyphosphatase-like protein [Dothidotthia symphoricarpi CBS 119687]